MVLGRKNSACYTVAMSRSPRVRSREGGGLEPIPQDAIDASQAWFWSERWQAMEGEADAAIAAGRLQRFNSAEDFLAELGKR